MSHLWDDCEDYEDNSVMNCERCLHWVDEPINYVPAMCGMCDTLTHDSKWEDRDGCLHVWKEKPL